MTINEMHIHFNLILKNFGTKYYNRIHSDKIDWILNYSMLQYIKELFSLIPEQKLTYVPSTLISSLGNVITSETQILNTTVDTTHTINVSQFILIFAQSLQCNTICLGRQFISIPIRCVDFENYTKLINDYHVCPRYNSPIAHYEGNRIILSCRTQREPFAIPQVQWRGIKYPTHMSLSGNVNCVLPEHVHYDICDRAAAFAKSLIDSNRLENIQNEPLNME